MDNNKILLSLCIPTNGKVEWIMPLIESIYSQRADNSLFEVVITDNGVKDDLENALKGVHYTNFNYFRTSAQGFTNQVDAFERCRGLFCKMLNHRSRLLPGSIEKLINLINKYKEEKPIIYCADGYVKGNQIVECPNIDEFIYKMSYWISWSAGTGAWKSDLVDLRVKKADKMFPHTLFLFDLRDNSKYVIWNERYEVMADDEFKGGYNVFEAFGMTFLDYMNNLRIQGKISIDTFAFIKKEMFDYLCKLYYQEVAMPSKHTFMVDQAKCYMQIYYNSCSYWRMVLRGRIKAPLARIKRLVVK